MQKVPLQLAAPDMVLAKPVTRADGMVLVGAGTALTASLLSRLEMMEIEFVVVEGEAVDAACAAEALLKQQEHLDHLFRSFKDDKYMQHIKRMLVEYYTFKCMAGAAASGDR